MGNWSNYLGTQGKRGLMAPGGTTPLGNLLTLAALGFSLTSAVWTANRAVYMPVVTEIDVTVTDLAIYVVTQAGNVDAGIYDFNGNLMVSNGGVACAAAGVQVISIADTFLESGWYYIGFSSDSSTAVFRNTTVAAANARVCGVRQQSSAYPLPSPSMTPEVYSVAVMPLVIASYSATF